MFSAVVPELRAKADSVKADLKTLSDLKSSLDAEFRDRNLALIDLEKSKAEINSLIVQKQAAAEAADKDLAAERKNAEELALRAQSLRDLLAQLEKARLKAEADKAAEEAKLAAAEAKRLAEQRAMERARELAAQTPFSKSLGQLRFPVSGTVLKPYGSDTGLGHALPGLALQAEAHAQVIAPIYGKVEFAGPFRSYGGLVIINAGEGYLVLLAGMDKILTSTGQSVKAGEPLGEMGLKSAELAISNDLTNQNFPVLYVEFRKNTDPIDPSPWWASNSREAQK
jgi:murein hydrolase activator